MKEDLADIWQFGDFILDVRRKVLRHSGTVVAMPLKELEVLSVLVSNRGELVTKDELVDAIWKDSFVEESNLSRHIYLLRKTLKELGETGEIIENIPRRGYRFNGDARPLKIDEVVVERRTQTRAVVELRNTSTLGSPVRLAAVGSLLLFAVVVSVLIGYRSLGKPSPSIKSIAVLPFRSIGANDAEARAGIGLADILTTRLSVLRDVRVMPANATKRLDTTDALGSGRMLQVDAVLEGALYYSNDRLRVTARLVRVNDSSIIWSGEFEKLRKDELQLQNDLANQIVPALAVNLSSQESNALAKQYTRSPEAYEVYISGRYEWNKRSTPGMIEAQRLFRNAVAIDPSFALAYVGLADTLLTKESFESEASAAIDRALELDPLLAEAHASRGFHLMFYRWQWSEAEAAFKRALDLNPNYATAHQWYATLLAIKGDSESAKAQMREALELNPLSHNFLADLGQVYYFAGEYVEAEKYCLKALEVYPDFFFAHQYLFFIYLKTGQYESAVTQLGHTDRINGSFAHDPSKVHDPTQMYREVFRERGINGYLNYRYPSEAPEPAAFYTWALKHAFLGENERALDYLERSVADRKFFSAFVKAEPAFEKLRDEPRYKAILEKLGLT